MTCPSQPQTGKEAKEQILLKTQLFITVNRELAVEWVEFDADDEK